MLELWKTYKLYAYIVFIVGCLGYSGFVIWKAYHRGKADCENQVIVKEATDVVDVKEKQAIAVANRPRDLDAVIERLQHGTY